MPASVRLLACPLCGTRSLSALAPPVAWVTRHGFADDLGVVACAGCGFEFTSPRPTAEQLRAYYQSDAASEEYGADRAEGAAAAAAARRAALQLAELHAVRQPAPGDRLLDVGCGGGQLLAAAARAGWRVAGHDVAARAQAACRASGGEVVDDLAAAPAQAFAAVTTSHTLEHVDDVVATLAALRRLLRDDGALLIEVPNRASLRARLSPPWARRWLGLDEQHRAFPVHLSFFTPTTLGAALERVGLRVVRATTVGLGLTGLRGSTPATAATPPPPRLRGPAPRLGGAARAAGLARLGKELARRRFMDALLGENLLFVAQV